MKKLKKIIVIIMIAISVMLINTYSFADVGSFDRYDSGSSWDSSDWGGSSSGSGDLGFLIGILLGNGWGRGTLLIIIVLVIIYSRKYKNSNYTSSYSTPQYNKNTNLNNVSKQRSQEVAKQVIAVDKLFSEDRWIAFSKDLFIKLQNAWTARDWEPMRLFETDELFEQHKAQVQGYIDTNRINVMDRICVDYAYLYNFKQEADKDILEVALKSTMKDYIIDATTKKVLEGNKDIDRHTVYKLTFERKKGVLTQEDDDIKTTNCPNCGAPTKITSAGRCQYCDSIILIGNHGWVLSGLEPLR